MQAFEFHFNPKTKPNLTFDSFCYEPVNIYEKRMGSLYIVGLLDNALPQHSHFIEKMAKVIKDYYYRKSILKPERSLKESLKVTNEFLDKLIKRGDVSWLGNLNLTVLSLKDFKLHFAKVGDIKILVVRKNAVIDVDRKIEPQDVEPYPLKVFSNTISGKLAEDDLILIFTKDVYEFFVKEKIISLIAQSQSFDEKLLKKVLDDKREKIVNLHGIFLSIVMVGESAEVTKETISPEVLKDFSFKEIFSPILNFLKTLRKERPAPPIPPSPDEEKKRKGIAMPEIKLPTLPKPKISIKPFRKINDKARSFFSSLRSKLQFIVQNKNTVIIVFLLVLMMIGSFFATREEEIKINIYAQELEEIEENLVQVDSYLLLQEAQPEAVPKANILLVENLNKISSLIKKSSGISSDFTNRAFSLRNEITRRLSDLNGLIIIERPDEFYEFKKDGFIPYNMAFLADNIYFSSPYSHDIFRLQENGTEEMIQTDRAINLSADLEDSLAFFSEPKQLIVLREGTAYNVSLEPPYPNFKFSKLDSFNENLYFLDKKSGQIIKYPFLGQTQWGTPESWLESKITKVVDADSMTIDGSVWILRENSIQEYYGGQFVEELTIELFPAPQRFSKISTDSDFSNLYVLEPSQNRIIILDKQGVVVKQFQSENFDNLLDFTVSADESAIYLLNGLIVYKIDI